MTNSFAFILNPLKVESEIYPIEITPGYFLQKADEEQIKVLHYVWVQLPASTFWLKSYEFDFGVINEPKEEPIKLAPADLRYWVISHNNDINVSDYKKRRTFFNLDCALTLSRSYLETGLVFFNKRGTSFKWNPRSFYSYFLDYSAGGRPATQITYEEAKQIGVNHVLISDFFKKMSLIKIGEGDKVVDDIYQYKKNFQYIEHAINQFLYLKALPRYTGLTIIGLFSIIESLITHKPHPQQNLDDSLNHQVKTKIPLLRKKFQRPLEYDKFFLRANEETIWGKLYDFRSKIVHDGIETIGADNGILKDLESVTNFLRETTSLLILLALKEPEFITDLKKC